MNDIISIRMHRKWKQRLISQISQEKYKTILDICCGTGDISFQLAQHNPQATLCGLDFSENMLAVAEERKTQAGLHNVRFLHGNAMELPFADSSFQCAAISFGLRNVPDYTQVLREAYRILEPNGMFCCLDSSYPDSPFIKPFFKIYFKMIMPAFGKIFAHHKAEYQWLNESTEQFLKKHELLQLLQEVGFKNTSVRSYLFGSAALHRGSK